MLAFSRISASSSVLPRASNHLDWNCRIIEIGNNCKRAEGWLTLETRAWSTRGTEAITSVSQSRTASFSNYLGWDTRCLHRECRRWQPERCSRCRLSSSTCHSLARRTAQSSQPQRPSNRIQLRHERTWTARRNYWRLADNLERISRKSKTNRIILLLKTKEKGRKVLLLRFFVTGIDKVLI